MLLEPAESACKCRQQLHELYAAVSPTVCLIISPSSLELNLLKHKDALSAPDKINAKGRLNTRIKFALHFHKKTKGGVLFDF